MKTESPQAWWCTAVILAVRKLKQKDGELQWWGKASGVRTTQENALSKTTIKTRNQKHSPDSQVNLIR